MKAGVRTLRSGAGLYRAQARHIRPSWERGSVPYIFTAELWIWSARQSTSWTFVTVPTEQSDDLREQAAAPAAGFGSIRVEVTIGESTWRTSVFPDKKTGCYVLPVKAAIRKAEGVGAGDRAEVSLEPV